MILHDDGNIIDYLKMYYEISGISCFAINETGDTIYAQGITLGYCSAFKRLTGERCPCSSAHLYASRQSEKIGEPYIYFCPGGLVQWTSPIIVNGLFKGALIGGPVQMSMPDDYQVTEIIKANNFDISNFAMLKAYLNAVPIVEPGRVRSLSAMLYILAKDIMAEERELFTERKKFYQEQAAINEKIQNVKEYQDHITKYYPIELENELVSKVKKGDKVGAKTILNELLGHVLFTHGSNLEITKARVLELLIMLSRAAVEGGGDLEMIFGMKLKYLNEIYQIDTVESLCIWIIKVLERFTDCVFISGKDNNSYIIQKAINYINNNYMNNISLESAAEYVYISTSYFSRLFKKELGINFVNYLNKVRVEESKKYLTDLKIPISDIAHMVGFTDQSYYTKVFKRIEGISPGQFRRTT